jgi:uncharacterized protein with PQ loop repeat
MVLWNVYIIVIIGILGFIVQKAESIKKKDIWLFMGAFTVFAFSNGVPLFHAQKALVEIHKNLPAGNMFSTNDPWIVVGVHAIFDFMVLWYLWFKANKAN